MLKFYGAVTTPEFTSSKDMWKITSGKEIYSTSPVTMDVDSYYSGVIFYNEEINLRSGIVTYGSNGISTLNIDSNSVNYMVFKDCNDALTISKGDLGINNIVVTNSTISGITYSSNSGEGGILSIEKCILNNIAERGIYILWSNYYTITNIYFNNIYYAIYIRGSNGLTQNNIFNDNNYYIYFYKNCTFNEVYYNNFYKTNMGLYLTGNINNINNNNFYGPVKYYIIDITKIISPYSLVSADVNATNNYWAVDDISQYLVDAEDDPRCPYHVIYLPKLSNPVRNAGIF